MLGFILCGHGNFASGLYSSVKLIAGKQDDFEIVNFESGLSSEQLKEKLIASIEKLDHCENIVIFTDLAGGTPFNEAAKLSLNYKKVRVLSGVNLPILLDSIFKRESKVEEFIDHIIQSGKDGIKRFEADAI